MARANADKEQQLPVQGLNTEANKLYFPEGFFADGLNVEADYDPQRIRVRKGLSETGTVVLTDTRSVNDNNVAIKSFLWKAVNKDASLNYVVVQVGSYLYFFEDDGLANPDTAKFTKRIDMSNSLSGTTKGTLALLERTPLQFEVIKGRLMVVGEPIDPTLIIYDPSGPSMTAYTLDMKIRDTVGLDSEIEVDFRPSVIGDFPVGTTASATYTQIGEKHEYNLYNQGWYQQRRLASAGAYSDPIASFFSTNSEYPSNSDIVWVGMVESSGDLIFDAEWLKDQTFGSSPAPRGHYIVDLFDINRAAILAAPQSSGGTTGGGGAGGETVPDGADTPDVALP